MSANDHKRTLRVESGPLVEGLAQQVVSQVDAEARALTPIQAGIEHLVFCALSRSTFDTNAVRSHMDALHLDQADIIDHCIPEAARMLGNGWLADQLSFAKVSTASARLFGLCKAVGGEWRNVSSDRDRAVLLATVGREDHLIGPTILSEQLRRRGISVQSDYNTTAETILRRMRGGCHESVWISASSHRSLDLACEAIKRLREAGLKQPVILGGAILDVEHGLDGETGADLVTKDLDKALAAVTRQMVVT